MIKTNISEVRYVESGVEKSLSGPLAKNALLSALENEGKFSVARYSGRILSVVYVDGKERKNAGYEECAEKVTSRTLKL